MQVLLLNPPFRLSDDSPYSKTGAILPPLGLLHIASYLREKLPAVDVLVLDAPSELLTVGQLEGRLKAYSPDVVGFTVYTTTFSMAMTAASTVKRVFPSAMVVCGGPHTTIRPLECLASPAVDVAVLGEGEAVFTELIKRVSNGADLSGVPNLLYKQDGGVVRTQRANTPLDINAAPPPARDLIDMKLYRPARGTYKRLPATNLITSRGCPFSCNFCSKEIFGARLRKYSAQRIVDEIGALRRRYGIREVIFNDDVFTVDRRRIETLCDLLVERQLDITWSCSSRVNLVTPALLRRMKKAGCVSIGYGIEAGDPAVLAKIDKGFSLTQAKDAIRWTTQAGIETRAFYILGFPGESLDTIKTTLDTSRALNTDFVIYNLAIPLPGTEMYEEAKSKGLLLYDGVELYDRTDGPHPLIRLEGVSPEELVGIYRTAYKSYYLRPSYIFGRMKKIRSLEDAVRYSAGLWSFLSWMRTRRANTVAES